MNAEFCWFASIAHNFSESNAPRWHDGWKKNRRLTWQMSSRFQTKATTLESTFPLKTKKKTRKEGRVGAFPGCTHFATNRINESNRIEPEGNRWQSATNLTESSSSTGCVAPCWQLEERDRRWMTCRDLGWHMHMTPVKTSPFSLSLSRTYTYTYTHTLGLNPAFD